MKPSPRHRQLARIHIDQRELQIGDVPYRCMVQRVAGVRSCADADTAGRNAVIAEMVHVRHKREAAAQRAQVAMGCAPVASALPRLQEVVAALQETGSTWLVANRLAEKLFHTARTDWLRPDQVTRLAAALRVPGAAIAGNR